jgi:hypothetical protein
MLANRSVHNQSSPKAGLRPPALTTLAHILMLAQGGKCVNDYRETDRCRAIGHHLTLNSEPWKIYS